MSTSDAAELELRVGGGETATPLYRTTRATSRAARATTARKQQNEKISERFKQENHYDDDHYEETPSGKQCHPSAIRQEETHKGLILRTDRLRKEEAAHCVESKVQNQKPTGPRITSCLLFRLSRNLGLDKLELRLEKNLDPCLHSLTETQLVETGNSSCQVSGQTSPPHTSIKKASDSTLSERIPYPAKKKEEFRKSTSSPRSPFSPFLSLSPVSPVSSMDVTDDSVFYSPKLQRHRESPSPCEPGEGIRMGGSRRSRASTGPPSAGPGQDKERLASSYADLKYGIEPGRSFSVSSVLSSRPSGPGRISTGSRFMSVGDLSDSALTCGDAGKDLDQWSSTPDWTTEYDCQPSKDCRLSYFTSDPGKMRSKSLPRSLTRRLANWSSEDFPSPPVTTTTSKSAHLWSPNMNTCHIAWDKEAPQTPPPTSPLSPVSRCMSKPPSLSSPTSPSSPGASQQVDNLSPRGLLPSRGYVSSLSTFDESSDSSSDTTTDDEYYLETGEGKEKETEL
ncbi:hypothetical protein VZT92_014469 [Zoarces viviparus]|uniref:Uncharacterized protein n=1 Tax=Zoarces viviparus TaxID=48416 RepID=A0AAW1F048_ZOAVI